MAKPFLKWLGGKYRVLPRILPHLASGKRFVEPFLGSGAVALNVNYPAYLLNDINPDSVAVWQALKRYKQEFVDGCQSLFTPDNNTKDAYLELKAEFNSTTDSYRKAVLFVYLNRHGFNGLCRYNSKGGYNVAFGRYDKPYFPKEEFTEALTKIDSFQLTNKDFRDVFAELEEGDVVYCDPPYVPSTASWNPKVYSATGFGPKDQEDLAKLARESKATVVISNHSCGESEELYKGAEIHKFKVARAINMDASNRKAVEEVLAVFSPSSAS